MGYDSQKGILDKLSRLDPGTKVLYTEGLAWSNPKVKDVPISIAEAGEIVKEGYFFFDFRMPVDETDNAHLVALTQRDLY